MNICFVYKEDYPWDVRVEKICNSLIKEGHSLFLVCRNTKNRQRKEKYKDIQLVRLPSFGGSKIGNIASFSIFINPIWIYYIFDCVRRHKINLIIVRDLPLVLAAVLVAKIFKIKIFFDMAECYPEMYSAMLKYGNNKFLNFFLRNPPLTNIIEWLAIKSVDHTFVVVEESRDRLLKKVSDSEKISILGNTPFLYDITYNEAEDDHKKSLKIVYVGFITSLRGIENAILGLKEYYSINLATAVKFELHILGDGSELEYLKSLVVKVKLKDFIFFHGWVKPENINSFFKQSDIGIVPHRVCAHTNTTVPNKLYDYMAMGLPVLASNTKSVKRIIEE
ncbi:MAG: glycosyltransferase [Candidatus Competibacteraceae bacterium]|nr:glycosyltransferase [Candidatus Competibacteraceae bacterium]